MIPVSLLVDVSLPSDLRYPLSRLHDLHLQLFGLLPSPLVPVCQCEAGYTGQGIWMLLAEYPQTVTGVLATAVGIKNNSTIEE